MGETIEDARRVAQRIVEVRGRGFGLTPEDREDLLQEVLVKYVRAWTGDSAPDNIEAWLETVTGRLITDRWRAEQRRPAVALCQDPEREPYEIVADFVELARSRQPSMPAVGDAVIDQVLGLLPSADADLLQRRLLDDADPADLADDPRDQPGSRGPARVALESSPEGSTRRPARAARRAPGQSPSHLRQRTAMTDSRFTTVCDDLESLLAIVDVDGIEDLDTLVMALLDRPVSVTEGWDEDQDVPALDVRVHGGEVSLGVFEPFPTSLLQIARSAGELARDVGPYAPPGEPPIQGNDVLSLSDEELLTALKGALGQVRLFNLLDDDQNV